ncbi:MAG: hypothetical protein K9L61_04665 [Candidatus Omnitrophica bacterium]|nr:hypothetical protein [Candidatus Omnitrophota bacterium]
MNKKLQALFLVLIFLGQGCALFTKAPQLLTLKRLGDNQKQMQRYVDKKKKYLAKLINDIEAHKLKKGTSYKRFLRSYGEPVLEKEIQKEGSQKRLLYRNPVQYFNTDKVYVYFNPQLELIAWKYIAKEEEEKGIN